MWVASCLVGRASVMAFLASSSRQVVHSQHRQLRSTISQSSSSFSTTRMSAAAAATASEPSKQYALRYDYIPEVLEKRGPYREKHLGLAKQLIEEGKCFSGGPIGPPGAAVPTGALFLFADLESAQSFVAQDPYIANGIVTAHYIDEWNIVVRKE